MTDVLLMTLERTVYGQRLYVEKMVPVETLDAVLCNSALLLKIVFEDLRDALDKHEREINTKKLPLP